MAPLANRPFLVVPGFIAAYSTILIILNFLIAQLLVYKARIEKDGNRMNLAVAFFFCGIVSILYLLAYPGALVPGIIIGTAQSAPWLWVFWYGGFAILMIGYCARARPDGLAPPRLRQAAVVCLLMLGAIGYFAFAGVRHLPPSLRGVVFFPGAEGLTVRTVLIGLNVAATGFLLFKFRLRTAEDIWLALSMLAALADVCLGSCGGARYTIGWYMARVGGLGSVLFVLVTLLNDVLLGYKLVTVANEVLDKLTLTDALTNLGNRRLFDKTLATEWRRCRRYDEPLAVVMIDVDNFKTFNDAYGHQAGDACLQEIAAQLARSVSRPGDVVVRYGGEEFALILPATDSDGANHLCKLIRLRIRDLAILHEDGACGIITVSAGLASLVPSEHFEALELLKLADAALYRAKAAGRDTVIVAG